MRRHSVSLDNSHPCQTSYHMANTVRERCCCLDLESGAHLQLALFSGKSTVGLQGAYRSGHREGCQVQSRQKQTMPP